MKMPSLRDRVYMSKSKAVITLVQLLCGQHRTLVTQPHCGGDLRLMGIWGLGFGSLKARSRKSSDDYFMQGSFQSGAARIYAAAFAFKAYRILSVCHVTALE